MAQELGETREKMAMDCWTQAEKFAENMKSETRPFYIVFFAKPDADIEGKGVKGIRQAFKAYFARPVGVLGILVWYVDHSKSEFSFVPELSSPPDVHLDPRDLSGKSEDQLYGVMEKGKKLNVLVS